MFEISTAETENIQDMKYSFNELPEFPEKEMLSMEKDMLGSYISGHPLDKYRDVLEKQTNINSIIISEANSQLEANGECSLKDNSNVKLVGIITDVKKKYTKSNKLMAFITVEDLYGTVEIISFETCYNKCAQDIIEDNIVIIEGRLSVREQQQDVTIIANSVSKFEYNHDESIENTEETGITKILSKKRLVLDITDLDEAHKAKLRGAIRFFSGDRNNIALYVKQGEKVSSCGGIFINEEILYEFSQIVGNINVLSD
jgi:DNA polymerase-3 subunit alpha